MFNIEKLAPSSKTRPAPAIEQLVTSSLINAVRDLGEIVKAKPELAAMRLAYEGAKLILENGKFPEGHKQENYISLEAPSPWSGRKVKVDFHVQVLDGNRLDSMGIDFYIPYSAGVKAESVFRCYITADPQRIKEMSQFFNTLKAIAKNSEVLEADKKWENFGGKSMLGLFTESPVYVTCLSTENYVRMEALGIKSRDPEDLARYVLSELGIKSDGRDDSQVLPL